MIQHVLPHPDFDPKDMDHDIHEQMMLTFEDGNIQVLDLKKDEDRDQDVNVISSHEADLEIKWWLSD